MIFTFDGDAAGQEAALKAFGGDQNFVSQTYVAVEPDGLDPCDVRIKKGDAAVRELVARRVPLYRFVLANIVSKYDLDRADGRVDAAARGGRAGAPASATGRRWRPFAREIASMIGIDGRGQARSGGRPGAAERRRRSGAGGTARQGPQQGSWPAEQAVAASTELPDLRDPRFALERETLKLVLQHPMAIGRTTPDIGANDFTHPTYRAVWELVEPAAGRRPVPTTRLGRAPARPRHRPGRGLGGQRAGRRAVADQRRAPTPPTSSSTSSGCWSSRRCAGSPRSSRSSSAPTRSSSAEYNRMFGELAALEEHRRKLRDRMARRRAQ